MDQGGGLQGVSGGFAPHAGAGQPPQLVIDERQQLLAGTRITLVESVQNARDLVWGAAVHVRTPDYQ